MRLARDFLTLLLIKIRMLRRWAFVVFRAKKHCSCWEVKIVKISASCAYVKWFLYDSDKGRQITRAPQQYQRYIFHVLKMAASEPGVSSFPRDDNNWRKNLILQLQERNRRQTYCFADLISLRKIFFLLPFNGPNFINGIIIPMQRYYQMSTLCRNLWTVL